LTLTAQVPGDPLGILRPLKLTDPAPAVAPTVPVQVVVAFGVDATTRFPGVVGNVSENATPVRATVLPVGFVSVKVIVEVLLVGMLAGEKALLIAGGARTVTVADVVFPVPPLVEVTAAVVLFCAPAAVPVTFTEKVHVLLAGTVAPDRLIVRVPCVAVIAPPSEAHVPPVNPFGVDITKPAGNVSLKLTPVRL
jgi:hypothetical protein